MGKNAIYKEVYGLIDKSKFQEGIWMKEPDEVAFIHLLYDCFVLRDIFGTLSGFVCLPKNHPDAGKSIQEVEKEGVSAHRGLSYSSYSRADNFLGHNEDQIEKYPGYKFGFDCAIFDFRPITPKWENFSKERQDAILEIQGQTGEPWPTPQNKPYRDLPFVISETKKLAEQFMTRLIVSKLRNAGETHV